MISLIAVLSAHDVIRDLTYVHPLIRVQVEELVRALDKLEFKGPRFEVFETWRSPERQAYLMAKNPRVTEVQPWQSAHQYGLAVDFAGRTRGGEWTWEVPASSWRILRHQADKVGLVVPSPSWDPGHVEFSHWSDMRDLFIA